MYQKANVSGPDEFASLPEKDQIFWVGWMEALAERADENEIRPDQMDDLV